MILKQLLIFVLLTFLSQENVLGDPKCVFPFTYNGVVYDDCTAKDSRYNNYWCSTLKEYSPAIGSYIYCDTVATVKATYLGCYVDNYDDRDLDKRWIKLPYKMTVAYCHRECKHFQYFALQGGEDCFCGDDYGMYERRNDDCKLACQGNTNEMCGDLSRNSVYQHDVVSRVGETFYVGCFLLPIKRTNIPTWYNILNKMTMEDCGQFCKSFPYFGLLNGDWCYCGLDYLADDVTDDSKCNIPCAGNANQMCGSSGRISVYQHAVNITATYIGCNADSESERNRSARWIRLPLVMTIGFCHELCKYFPYFALHAGDQCFCSNSYVPTPGVCNSSCHGNSDTTCGGTKSNSVYQHRAKAPLFETIYIGCFMDTLDRDLNGKSIKMKDSVNADECDRFCESFTYFGIQNGTFCLCGMNYGRHGVRPDSECSMECLGSVTDLCGGVNRNSVYRREVTNGCGVQNIPSNYQSRIAFSNTVSPGEFPWMAKILMTTRLGTVHCTGVLIEDKWILTNAHCVNWRKLGTVDITLGDTNLNVKEGTEQYSKAKGFFTHPNYVVNIMNDIGLIRLKSPVKLNKYVHPVCLPHKDDMFENLNCTAVGYGKTETDSSKTILRKAIFPTISNTLCKIQLPVTTFPEYLCAGHYKIRGSPAIQPGDSGGALICSRTGSDEVYRWTLAGLTALGIEKKDGERVPFMFMRITSYLTWIKETIRRHS